MTLLADLIRYSRDGEWGQADPGPGLVKMRIVRGTDFDLFRTGDLSKLPVRYISEKKARQKTLRPDDILIETAGGTASRPTGRTVLVRRSTIERSDLPLACASFARFLRLDREVVDPAYVYLWLDNAWKTRDLLKFNTQHTGVSRFQWTKCSYTTDISLPDRVTQARVAGPILAMEELVDRNRRRIQLLEQMAQAIYQEWFLHLRYPGYDGAPLVGSSLGPIPEGWGAGTIDELVRVVTTTVDPSELDPATPAVGLEHIPRRQLTLAAWATAGELGSRKAVFEAGDVLFGKIRPYFHKVSVAPMNGICSTDAIVIRPSPDYWGPAVFILASDDFVANATQTSNGTKMPRADWKVIRHFPVLVPPAALASQFTNIARDALGVAQRLMFKNRELSALRDVLLPRLITGRIDVSKLDLDSLVESVA